MVKVAYCTLIIELLVGKVWCFGEVVAYGRWLHMEVPLYSIKTSIKDTCLATTSKLATLIKEKSVG